MKTASMTQQQKREKAAELLGWVKNKHPISGEELWCKPTLIPRYEGFSGWPNPPRYDEDLNLMAEAEKVLTFDQSAKYVNLLWPQGYAAFRAISATASQRLDAWLEVMMEEKR